MAQSESTLRNNEPAFVLHTYPYRETSLTVEALSRHAVRVALQIKHHLGQQELQTRQLLRDLQELRFNLASTSTTSPRFAASGRRCGASSAVGTILDIKAM